MTTINDVTEADLERDRLRELLDDCDVGLILARDKVTQLKARLAKIEAKAEELRDQIDDAVHEIAELQRAHDRAWEDYDELGGHHIDAMVAGQRND